MIGKTAVGIAIVEAAVRHPLCNAPSMAIFIFPTAPLPVLPVPHLCALAKRDMGVIWIGTGTV